MPIILDVEYSQYIHFIFTIWVCYFIFYCSILFATFVGARTIYAHQYVHGLWVLRIFSCVNMYF